MLLSDKSLAGYIIALRTRALRLNDESLPSAAPPRTLSPLQAGHSPLPTFHSRLSIFKFGKRRLLHWQSLLTYESLQDVAVFSKSAQGTSRRIDRGDGPSRAGLGS